MTTAKLATGKKPAKSGEDVLLPRLAATDRELRDIQLPGGDYIDMRLAHNLLHGFFPLLRLSKGEFAGKPIELLPYQWNDIVKPLLCRKKPDGRRRYRRAMIGAPRKFAKTTLAAAVSLAHFYLVGDQGGEQAFIASDAAQSAIAFGIVRSFIQQEPALAAITKLYKREAVNKVNGTVMRCYTSNYGSVHGANLSFALLDETHCWKGGSAMHDAVLSGCAGRQESQVVEISTAGDSKGTMCYQNWRHAEAVMAGEIEDPDFLPVIYGIKPGEDWTDRKVWERCNPGLGKTVFMDFLESSFRDACAIPAKQAGFRQLHLNDWSAGDSNEIWITREQWAACKGDRPDDETLKKSTAVIGIDIGPVSDMSAVTVVWRLPDERVYVDAHGFICEDKVHQERASMVPFRKWAKDGLITIMPGGATDFAHIRDKVRELAEKYSISEVCCDRYQMAQLAAELAATGLNLTGHGQGFASMTCSSQSWERAVLNRKLIHSGNELLAYCNGNCGLQRDGTSANQKPTKLGGKDSRDRIDALVAGVMAVGRLDVIAPAGVEQWDGNITII
jgi:phage terminase large subunit-like protein